ncbi:MAG: hypothetical protein K2K29_02655 [Muribaculaceae bacterium]|nr:hypothetical protein [Muribaculaceae bacterium]
MKILGYLFWRGGKKWLALMLLVVVGLIVAGWIFGDVRFVILASMVGLLMLPMIFALVFINYALHPDIAYNVLPHTLEIDDAGLKVRIILELDEEVNDEERADENNEERNVRNGEEVQDIAAYKVNHKHTSECGDNCIKDGENDSMENNAEFRESVRIIPYELLRPFEVGTNYVLVPFYQRGLIYIPSSAFNKSDDFSSFINGLVEGMRGAKTRKHRN